MRIGLPSQSLVSSSMWFIVDQLKYCMCAQQSRYCGFGSGVGRQDAGEGDPLSNTTWI